VIKYYLLVLIKQLDFGMHKLVSNYKCCKDIKIKFSLVCLTMREILLLQDQKIIHVKFGEIQKFIRINEIS